MYCFTKLKAASAGFKSGLYKEAKIIQQFQPLQGVQLLQRHDELSSYPALVLNGSTELVLNKMIIKCR